jgi:hypothetical protein
MPMHLHAVVMRALRRTISRAAKSARQYRSASRAAPDLPAMIG